MWNLAVNFAMMLALGFILGFTCKGAVDRMDNKEDFPSASNNSRSTPDSGQSAPFEIKGNQLYNGK